MEKTYKYLLKNLGLLTVSNLGTKLLSFLMVPLYTRYLTTVEFGIFELVLTTVHLAIPILSLNIVDGVVRFSLDENSNKKEIFKIGIILCLVAYLLFGLITYLGFEFGRIILFRENLIYLIVYFILNLMSDFLFQALRGLDKVKEVAISSLINSIFIFSFNIYFLAFLKMGLKGYFLANWLGFLISIMYMGIKLKIWEYISFSKINYKLLKEMLLYTIPIGIGNIGWWITNVSDRYMVTLMCGVGTNGLYAAAYKIPSFLMLLQMIFKQAWILSAVKEFKKEQKNFYTEIYRMYNGILIIGCSFLIFFNKEVAMILFKGEFFTAWKYAPFLIISVVFSSLAQFLGGILEAAKKSITFGKTILIGATVNIIFNFILIEKIGATGAAIATLISYFTIWYIRTKEIKMMLLIKLLRKGDFISYFLLICQAILISYPANRIILLLKVSIFIIILLLNYLEIYHYLKKILKK